MEGTTDEPNKKTIKWTNACDLLDEFSRPVLVTDSEWTILQAGKALKSTFGISHKDVLGMNLKDFFGKLNLHLPLESDEVSSLTDDELFNLQFFKGARSMSLDYNHHHYTVKIKIKNYDLSPTDYGHFVSIENVKSVSEDVDPPKVKAREKFGGCIVVENDQVDCLDKVFSSIVDQSDISIFIQDAQNRYVTASKKGLYIGQIDSLDELRGKTIVEIGKEKKWDTYATEKLFKLDQKVIETGKPIHGIEVTVPQGDSSAAIRQISSRYPIYNKNDEIVGLLGFSLDLYNYWKAFEDYRVTMIRP